MRSVEETVNAIKLAWYIHRQINVGTVVPYMQTLAALSPAVRKKSSFFFNEVSMQGFTSGFIVGAAWANSSVIPFDQRFLCDQAEEFINRNLAMAAEYGVDLYTIDLPEEAIDNKFVSERAEEMAKGEPCGCPRCKKDRGEGTGDGPLPDLFAEEKQARILEDVEAAIAAVYKKHGLKMISIKDLFNQNPQG